MARNESTAARQSLAEDTYLKIRRALVDGEFEPGQRLSEPELALKFNISRSPIREALVRLEHESFIDRQPNGRMLVKVLDIDDLTQLYEVRAVIEGFAARLAAPLLRTVDLERMSARIDAMEKCVSKGDPEGALAAGQDFHDIITQECPNRRLIEVLSGLRARISRYRSVVASLGDYEKERVVEHRRILKALYQRNADAAQQEVTRHVQRSADTLVKKLTAKWEREKKGS
jgi:DNA-binding GntR family transcriptional regulator